MRPYETLVVLRTDLGEEAAKLLTRFESVIAGQGGTIDEKRDWGVRDLAYPISKQKQGHYHLLEYQAEPQTVKELERNLRIVEGVLRFVSVQQEHTGLPEPRVREHYDRRDTPLHEMRSSGRDEPPAAGTPAAGTPAAGTQAAGTQAAGTQGAEGPALEAVAPEAPAAEAPAEDTNAGAPADEAGEMQS